MILSNTLKAYQLHKQISATRYCNSGKEYRVASLGEELSFVAYDSDDFSVGMQVENGRFNVKFRE